MISKPQSIYRSFSRADNLSEINDPCGRNLFPLEMITRPFDIIVFGATGYTGQLIAEYLAQKAPLNVKFAIAGRSRLKLEHIAKSITKLNTKRFGTEGIPIIIADSGNRKSIDEMVIQAKVLITTVGPYAKYGDYVVASCVNNKTDYCDLSGEPQFVQDMIEKYHDLAEQNQVSIVHACGFDSIPSDLGSLIIADYFKSKNLKTNSIRLSVIAIKGQPSGGTLASAINMIESMSFKKLYQLFDNPDSLVPNSIPNNKIWKGNSLYYDKGLKTWQAPFFMEATNLRIVRRSNGLLDYGPNFQYCEGQAAKNAFFALLITIFTGLGGILLLLPPVRWLISKILPPGTGPSENSRKSGFFNIVLYGDAIDEDGNLVGVQCKVKGIADPGYQETSKMISESALCLLEKQNFKSTNFPIFKGGILTPASAMGIHLVERLRQAEMTFEIQNQ